MRDPARHSRITRDLHRTAPLRARISYAGFIELLLAT